MVFYFSSKTQKFENVRTSKNFLYIFNAVSYIIHETVMSIYLEKLAHVQSSSLFFEHILCPQCYKSQLLEFLIDIVIIDPTIEL